MTVTARLVDPGETEGVRDPAELDELYRRYGASLRRLCLRRLGNEADADDACQEALLKAWAALPRFDGTRRMWPWLATIAGNACIDVQRRQACSNSYRMMPEPAAAQPDEEAIRHSSDAIVREALGQLPRPAQTVLVLRDVEGWSYDEIGALQGRSGPAVRTAVTRARHHLRSRVEAVGRRQGQWPLPAVVLPLGRSIRGRIARARSSVADLTVRVGANIEVALGAVNGTSACHAALGALMLVVGVVPAAFVALGEDEASAASYVRTASASSSSSAVPTGGTSGVPATPAPSAQVPAVATLPTVPVAVKASTPTATSDGDRHRIAAPSAEIAPTEGPVDTLYTGALIVNCPGGAERSLTQEVRCAPLDALTGG